MNSTWYPEIEEPIKSREKHYSLVLYILMTNIAPASCFSFGIWNTINENLLSNAKIHVSHGYSTVWEQSSCDLKYKRKAWIYQISKIMPERISEPKSWCLETILVAGMSPNFECKSPAITTITLVLMTSCLQSVNNVVEEIGHWTQGNSCEQNAGASFQSANKIEKVGDHGLEEIQINNQSL